MNFASLRQLPVEQHMHLIKELWGSILADQEALPHYKKVIEQTRAFLAQGYFNHETAN